MSDEAEILTGKEATEASQGYMPMPPAPREIEEAQQEQAAVERIVQQMDSEALEPGQPGVGPPIEVSYNKQDGSGERSDENRTVEAERAAKDLADWRRGQEEAQRALKDLELNAEIERLRGTEAAQPQPQAQEPQPAEAQSSPAEQQIPGVEPEVAAALQNPKVLAAINQQLAANNYQAQQAQQYAAQVIDHNAKVAAASIFSHYPEIQQLAYMSPPQQQAAMQMLAQSNPERYHQIQQHIGGIQQVLQADAQVKQQQAVQAALQYQAEWSRFSADEDAKFEAAHPDASRDPQTAQRAYAYLEQLGFSKDDIGRAYNGHATISLRDHRAQKIIMDAMRYREAVAGVPQARRNTPPRVAVPGPAGQRASEDEYGLRDLNAKLNSSHSARDAANLLAARRARR